jgi:hypothetical protein
VDNLDGRKAGEDRPEEGIQVSRRLLKQRHPPDDIRRHLPEMISSHLEKVVSGRGDFRVTVADNLDGSCGDVRREATVGGATYAAFVYGTRLRQVSQRNIPLQGIAIDRSLAVLDDSAEPSERGLPASDDVEPWHGPWAGDVGGGSGYGVTAKSRLTQGTKTLLPAIKEVILSVDLKNGLMQVSAPDWL